MATFEQGDDGVVVGHRLRRRRRHARERIVPKGHQGRLFEAGKRESAGDLLNDEWASFGQLAWLDKRTRRSGSWRVAKDFPGLPAWICKTAWAARRKHWARCVASHSGA